MTNTNGKVTKIIFVLIAILISIFINRNVSHAAVNSIIINNGNPVKVSMKDMGFDRSKKYIIKCEWLDGNKVIGTDSTIKISSTRTGTLTLKVRYAASSHYITAETYTKTRPILERNTDPAIQWAQQRITVNVGETASIQLLSRINVDNLEFFGCNGFTCVESANKHFLKITGTSPVENAVMIVTAHHGNVIKQYQIVVTVKPQNTSSSSTASSTTQTVTSTPSSGSSSGSTSSGSLGNSSSYRGSVTSSTSAVSSNSSTSYGVTTYVDTTRPEVSSISVDRSTIKNRYLRYTIRFTESVNNFTSSCITVNKGTVSLSGSGSTYVATVSLPSNSEYVQTFSVNSGTCYDSARNVNIGKTAESVNVDTIPPIVKSVSSTKVTNIQFKEVTKRDSVQFVFDATDNNFSASSLTTDDIKVRINGRAVSATKALTNSNIDKGKRYTLTLSNITSDLNGRLAVEVESNTVTDYTGNTNECITLASNLVINNTPVELQKVNIQTDNTNKSWARNGSTVKVYMKFSATLAVMPTVKIAGRATSVITSDLSGYDYVAKYHISENENSLTEGNIGFEISGYSSDNGLTGQTKNSTTDGSTVTYDRTKPTITSVNYNEEAGVAKNEEWRRIQKATITATDNLTTDRSRIKFEYEWVKEGSYSSNLILGSNGSPITKNNGTGKYKVYCKVTDLAGNEVYLTTNSFYLDNSVTKCGGVKVTYNTENGNEYKFVELTDDNGNKYYEGGYVTGDKLYIKKQDGSDSESGHKDTTYQVFRIYDYGTREETEVAVGNRTTQDTQILNNGDYKIVVTTRDNALTTNSAQSPNVVTKTYILHKGKSNIEFLPNGISQHTVSVSTRINLKDSVNVYKSASYAWAKEGEEPTTYRNLSIQNLNTGETIYFDSNIKDNGRYNLYIKTIDINGNTNITKSESFYVANKVANPGTIGFKLNDEKGGEYTEKTYTNENVFVYIKDQGRDDFGGTLQNTYSIEKDSNTVVGSNTTEGTILKESGKYTISLKTTNSLGAIKYQTYQVWIDKDKPVITFSGVEDYVKNGHISVRIADDGVAKSGINTETMKYYWTRSTRTPSLQDFEGTTENGLRGKITSTSSSINIPTNVSGTWYLWVYAEDNVGNSTISSAMEIDNDGNVSYIDNEPPIAGTLRLTDTETWKEYKTTAKVDDKGKIINEGVFTKNYIRIELVNGYDADSGVKSNVYSITRRNDNKVFARNVTDCHTMLESGIYDIKVETTDNKDNKSTREYVLKMDKNAPSITFNPNVNITYAKKHEVTVSITEPETESGVNNSKTQYIWIGYNPEITKISSKEHLLEKMKEIQQKVGEGSENEYIYELNNNGIDYLEATKNSEGKIITPSEKTGIYYLYVKAEDNLGNTTITMSNGFNIDNTIPTTPNIRATKPQLVGTLVQDVNYYGEKTNKDVTVIAENSNSLSGVDKYEYTYVREDGEWSEWKSANQGYNENGAKIGSAVIEQHGRTVVKFRSISELQDGTLVSEETEEFTVNIDKRAPKVTFANYDNGENGSAQNVQSIKVRITATDESGINENTLKYKWIKFSSIEEYKELAETSQDNLEYFVEGGTILKNGEEVPSPKNASGIYAILTSVEDSFGNKNISYSNYYSMVIDVTAPKVTFANYDNGENGSVQNVQSIKVRITATDESGINENTLRYNWVKFDTIEKYNELANKNQQELEKIMGEGITFKNGEEIPSPELVSGIYAILTSVEDIYGNKVISYSNYYSLITDKTAPKVTFANYDNGQNGSTQSIQSIKVRITATDESGINENTLRYNWVKFDTIEKYNELANKNQQELEKIMGEGITFKNGEEIPSPELVSGIYAILTSVEDIYGNKVISYSNYYALNLENDEKVNYQITGEFITRVLPETTCRDFSKNITKYITGTKYEIFDSKGNKLDDTDYVTTDSVLKVDSNKQFKIAVIGDVNGDGKMNGLDLARVRLYLVGKLSLNSIFEKAVDINNDSKQNAIDLSKMRLILVGLAEF